MSENKPPLGLAPKFKVDFDREEIDVKRGIDIVEAMWRYLKADKIYPAKWFDELFEIHDAMKDRRKDGFKDGTVKNLGENHE